MNEAELRDLISQTERGTYGPVGPKIELPVDQIVLTEPLVISQRAHFSMKGMGSLATVFKYQGDPNEPAIVLERCLKSDISGFSVLGKCAAGVSIRTSEPTTGWPISSENQIRDVNVRQGAEIGFFVDSRRWSGNNEFHLFERCTAKDCGDSGFKIYGSQAHRLRYRWCNTQKCRYGLWGAYGNYWTWEDGQSTRNEIDFVASRFWIQTAVLGHRTEGSKRLYATGGEWSPMEIRLERITWDGRPEDDDRIIKISSNGPITIQDVNLYSLTGNPMRVIIFDHDPGSLKISGLRLMYKDPPYNDTPQAPIIIPDHFRLSEFGLSERIISIRLERILDTRPAPDPERGKIDVELSQTEYEQNQTLEVDWPLPDSNKHQRSMTIAFNATVTSERPREPELMRFGNFPIWIHQAKHLRVEGSVTLADVDPVIDQTYPVVVSYDRDRRGKTIVRFGDRVETRKSRAELFTPNKYILIGARREDGRGRLNGRIENLRVWDRALSEEEVRMI